VGRAGRRLLRARRIRAARRRPAVDTWELGRREELEHWEKYLATCGSEWPEEYARRTDPGASLQDIVRAAARTPAGGTVRILDVGAGPLTWLGTQWPDRTVELVAIDALARDYDALLARYGVAAIVRSRPMRAEELGSHFPACSFDVVHARNSLDHTIDPLRAVTQMAGLTRPGGAIVLQHHRDVAEFEAYAGLHQWNLRLDDRRLVLWRPGGRRDVLAELGSTWTLEQGRTADDWDDVVLRRSGAAVCEEVLQQRGALVGE
jgi:SAM-dependent methyltransferase